MCMIQQLARRWVAGPYCVIHSRKCTLVVCSQQLGSCTRSLSLLKHTLDSTRITVTKIPCRGIECAAA
jgi:hypothetical protein